MNVVSEVLTVLPDPLAGEVSIIVPGLRITLALGEAGDLAAKLRLALDRTMERDAGEGAGQRSDVGGSASDEAKRGGQPDRRASIRAAINANMKRKGLMLRMPEGQ